MAEDEKNQPNFVLDWSSDRTRSGEAWLTVVLSTREIKGAEKRSFGFQLKHDGVIPPTSECLFPVRVVDNHKIFADDFAVSTETVHVRLDVVVESLFGSASVDLLKSAQQQPVLLAASACALCGVRLSREARS